MFDIITADIITTTELEALVLKIFHEFLHLLLYTIFVNRVSAFFTNGKSIFNNSQIRLSKIPPHSNSLDSCVFDNFTAFNELLVKAFQRLEICLLPYSEQCGNLVSTVPVMFDDNLKVTSTAFLSQISVLEDASLINLSLNCDIESFYINTK